MVGAWSYVSERVTAAPEVLAARQATDQAAPGLRAYIAIDGTMAGVVEFADRLRDDAIDVMTALDTLGLRRRVLLSGDQPANVDAIARAVGFTEAHGEFHPADKARFISALEGAGEVVLMVGDGINDAPALTAASVGIALAAHGGGISAEAADIVLLADHLDRVPEAITISRRTIRIARQSIVVGLGLSVVAMTAAALGFLRPALGAGLQEAIDVAVILNALRSSRGSVGPVADGVLGAPSSAPRRARAFAGQHASSRAPHDSTVPPNRVTTC
jgi:P-type E1-E2 ATPase